MVSRPGMCSSPDSRFLVHKTTGPHSALGLHQVFKEFFLENFPKIPEHVLLYNISGWLFLNLRMTYVGHEHEDPQNLRIQILEKALEGILELYI